MRIPSGVTDQVIYFVAQNASGARLTGLTTFTVYRSRNTTTATAMTTPTVTEVSAANMPGVYTLLLDEDMTIGTGNDTEAMVFHISQADMLDVTREIELFRPKITAGETALVDSNGRVDVIKVAGTAQTAGDLAALITTVDTVVDGIQTDLDNGTDGLGAIKGDTAAILTDTAEIGAAGAGLTEAGGTGDHLTAITLPAQDVGGIDVSELNGIVDDLLNGGRLDLLIDAIKAKTDSLTFTKANEVDANIQSINGAGVVGDGNATPWDGE